jgi:hypothetical protein
VFKRVREQNENAFSFLVPEGWKVEGGVVRVNPLTAGGSTNVIAAKVEIRMTSPEKDGVTMHWLPEVIYFDMAGTPTAGMFPVGSNYQGMTVYPKMGAQMFIMSFVLPSSTQGATGMEVGEAKSLPKLAELLLQEANKMGIQHTFAYDACVVPATFTLNGTRYKQVTLAAIEDWGQLGVGMWGNKQTMYVRAPVETFDYWQKVFSVIQGSVVMNREWVAGELRGQAERAGNALATQKYIEKVDREIVEHRQKMNSEIRNDMYLNLTDQEEYKNPYTGETERGSNQWKHRWQAEDGTVVYDNSGSYDPNQDDSLKRTDFKRSEVRKRFGDD